MSEARYRFQSSQDVELELYFLIVKFLQNGPCQQTSEVLIQELEKHDLFPKRFDWKGDQHSQNFLTLEHANRHVSGDLLLRISQRIGSLLDKEVKGGVPGVTSLLGHGNYSLLRRPQDLRPPQWPPARHAALLNSRPVKPPQKLALPPNLYNVLQGRSLSGHAHPHHIVPIKSYNRINLHLRTLGHLSSVYCVTFDRTGTRIFTGSDDHLVKIWNALSGRLLATLRGHSAEIVDMHVNYENTMIAAASTDKVIRVWNIQTLSPIAVLLGHAGSITSLEFSPYNKGDSRYMASTGTDGCICFWQWCVHTEVFNPRPIKFTEKSTKAGAQMLCLSFSPGGMFLVAGSTDPLVRVYMFGSGGPEKVTELEGHLDRVDSIDFCHHGNRFVSGSKDGTARIWRYEKQSWMNITLNMSTKLPGCLVPIENEDDTKVMKHRVTMVGWDTLDNHVITAVNDHTLRVWNSYTGKLVHVLRGHSDEVFVLQAHPKDSRIFLSGGHDGYIILWDLSAGLKIHSFFNMIEGQGHGAIFDCMFNCYGDMFAATDSHGFLSIFGYGASEPYKKVPSEQYFHTDYRPLMRDSNNYVLDEQTQQAPHLMPPPFLVDIDGNPYPPMFQRLVPGRENCKDTALVPLIAVTEAGIHEVIGEGEGPHDGEILNEANQAASILDEMIHRMQEEQDAERGQQEAHGPRSRPTTPRGMAAPLSPNVISPRGLRRSGVVEGVRQAMGNIAIATSLTQLEVLTRRKFVPELPSAMRECENERRRCLGKLELQSYTEEEKTVIKLPLSIKREERLSARMLRKRKKLHGYRTRSNPIQGRENGESTQEMEVADEEDEEADMGDRVDSSSGVQFSDSSTIIGGSSDYSDWIEEAGVNLQPPKRKQRKMKRARKRKHIKRRSKRKVSDEDSQVTKSPRKKPKRRIKKKPPKLIVVDEKPMAELPETFKPSSWITDAYPRRCPYVPQMGDEIYYIWQGHQCYVEAVTRHNVFPIERCKRPWVAMDLSSAELMKVVGIKYHIGPPTTCGLKLAFVDHNTRKLTGGFIHIRYHDMADVIDFLVLAQHYDIALRRKWKPGDKFRSVIDDAWWLGTIESKTPFQPDHQDSLFQCFTVRWDNGEVERMSPWDLEPIDRRSVPKKSGDGVQVTPEELQQLQYKSKNSEWNGNNPNEECDRILRCMEKVRALRIAEMFNAPVDLSGYPDYAMVIPYPTDLDTICNRLQLRFYRRHSSLQWEVRLLESNARLYNEQDSQIVKSAKLLTQLLLKIIEDEKCEQGGVMVYYSQLSADNDMDQSEESSSSSSDDDSSSNKQSDEAETPPAKRRRSSRRYDKRAWYEKCVELVDMMFDCRDSAPFRQSVDESVYKNYREVIDHPMDLNLVRENLQRNFYQDPIEFAKDVRLIFTNSKSFNTNKRSKIYSMTLRLSALFEDQVRNILSDYKTAARHKPSSAVLRRRTWYEAISTSTASQSSHDLEDMDGGKAGPSQRNTRSSKNTPTKRVVRPPDSDESDTAHSRLTNGVKKRGRPKQRIKLESESDEQNGKDDSSREDSDTKDDDRHNHEEEETEKSEVESEQDWSERENYQTPKKKKFSTRGRGRGRGRWAKSDGTRVKGQRSLHKENVRDSPSMRTRNQGRRTVVYDEVLSEESIDKSDGYEDEMDEDDEDEISTTTVSSRGRIRKPTAKVRARLISDD